jgi:hypothetical protein
MPHVSTARLAPLVYNSAVLVFVPAYGRQVPKSKTHQGVAETVVAVHWGVRAIDQ